LRILLHVGMPKAGSTALQAALADARSRLAHQGILYPRGPLISRTHNFIMAGLEERPREMPRLLRNAYRGRLDEIAPAFDAWLAELRSGIASRRPGTLILSSEWLFRLRGEQRFDRLAEILRSLGDRIEVIAYVRRPSDQYLSSAQQILKGSHIIKPVAPIRYRGPIEGFTRIADQVHVLKYDRAAFPDGDIVRHFLATFTPGVVAAGGGGGDSAVAAVNATISAEGMAILAAYRRINHRRHRNRFTADTDRVLRAIRAADLAVGGNVRPRLRAPVRDEIDLASDDLLWLRDVYGIVFDGIDYGCIVAPDLPIRETKRRPKSIGEICEIDAERYDDVLMRTMHALAGGESPARASGGFRTLGLWLTGRKASAKR
jgi:hypothetical protein